MSKLLALRKKLNLTQEELFEKSGVSVRTIQRIEAGTSPQGYTLKALAKALEVSETDLIENTEVTATDSTKWLKLINLSALPFMLVPPLNIVIPLLIMFKTRQFTPVTKNILSLQVVWTLGAILLFITIQILVDWYFIRSKYLTLIPLGWLLVNSILILRNAAEIAKSKTLRISLNFIFI
ncbi:MAG: helix-turn-helix domain-containing protein [Williamsia sp.]|nr:helix-turn-helix domain-containing protein [Williamsia sp.]